MCTVHAAYPLTDPSRIPASRLRAMEKLGAVSALMMMSGQCPTPFDPLLFHYIVHSCDLRSLHEQLVAEWHPELRRDILVLKEMGAEGNLAPFRGLFATYWNADVVSFFEFTCIFLLNDIGLLDIRLWGEGRSFAQGACWGDAAPCGNRPCSSFSGRVPCLQAWIQPSCSVS